ncbi:MAG TPA: transcription antitermination factor NusB, partial [bacterium]|nr:transcription antitermination factor NusB [bacterium]
AGVFRNYIFVEYIANNYCALPPKEYTSNKKAVLFAGIYEILFGKEPAYAVVNENVNIAKSRISPKFAGFINAVLKKISDAKHKIFIARTNLNISIKYSIPDIILKNIAQNDFCKKNINDILLAYNHSPHYYININRIKEKNIDFKKSLTQDNIEFLEISKSIGFPIKITKLSKNINAIELIKNNQAYIQDLSSFICSQIIADELEKLEVMIDFCAAPGLKTISIINLLKNKNKKIVLCDIDATRLKITKENITNLISDKKILNNIQIIQSDALTHIFDLKHSKKKYLFYVDAPCTGTGIISRYPEMLMFKNQNDIDELSKTQYMLLSKQIKLSPPNTIFVYSVCSITYKETFEIIEKLKQNHKNIELLPISIDLKNNFNLPIKYQLTDNGLLFIPQKDIIDGFFISKFLVK